MATAQEYPITFGYGAKDGHYYGPNGIIGPYHRGDDRYMPTGTSLVVNGATLARTGATGNVSGPHLHTGRFESGVDTNPKGGGFNLPWPLRVQAVGEDSVNGKYIKLLDAEAILWVYLHLSEIYVTTGQIISEGDDMIPDEDVWYARFAKLATQITGKPLSRSEFRRSYVGKNPFNKVAELSDSQQPADILAKDKALADASNIAGLRGDRMAAIGKALGVAEPDSPQGFDGMLETINNLKATGEYEEIPVPVFRKKS